MLILQVKEARASVLEPYLTASPFANHAERVVRGQRLMQAASDVFLGWASSGRRDFYVRQFKDMKTAEDLDTADEHQLREYAHWCAWALATAHARSGDAAQIAGYIGKRDKLDGAPVSYTHLDVYKRQGCRRSGRVDHPGQSSCLSTPPVTAGTK